MNTHNGQKAASDIPHILNEQTATTNKSAVNDKRPHKGLIKNSLHLTVHSKNVTGLSPMAWRLSLSTLNEGWQTGSPLVPYKLPRLLPHKGRVPGRSRDSPSWTELLTVQQWAAGQGGDREKGQTPFPGSVCPFLEYGCCGSPVLLQYVSVYHALIKPDCFQGQIEAFRSNLKGKNIKKWFQQEQYSNNSQKVKIILKHTLN